MRAPIHVAPRRVTDRPQVRRLRPASRRAGEPDWAMAQAWPALAHGGRRRPGPTPHPDAQGAREPTVQVRLAAAIPGHGHRKSEKATMWAPAPQASSSLSVEGCNPAGHRRSPRRAPRLHDGGRVFPRVDQSAASAWMRDVHAQGARYLGALGALPPAPRESCPALLPPGRSNRAPARAIWTRPSRPSPARATMLRSSARNAGIARICGPISCGHGHPPTCVPGEHLILGRVTSSTPSNGRRAGDHVATT